MSISIPFVGKRNKDASPSRAERKPKVIPSISLLAQVRRVDDQTLEDYSGGRLRGVERIGVRFHERRCDQWLDPPAQQH